MLNISFFPAHFLILWYFISIAEKRNGARSSGKDEGPLPTAPSSHTEVTFYMRSN